MAIAATDERDRGQPTSWSAAVDALAAGRAFDTSTRGLVYLDEGDEAARRLFVLCAGNVDPNALQPAHLDRSDTDPIHDPGQAWNALTVGAFTEKSVITDPRWSSWQPVARPGDLSPWSTTGVTFAESWPIKPDVVFEGGNVVTNAKGEVDFPCPDLSLLSTHWRPSEKSFVLSWATSAATAQGARMAAMIAAEYPTLWPEAVRALIVHAAEWTPAMLAPLRGASGKRERARLVRRYGFGVPSIERALRSGSDALTLIAQDRIRPFAPKPTKPNERQMGDIHFFELPWPREVLQGLGETPVRLRVALSYFIEPNPGRRGWKKRHRYASHGLRFEVKGPTESMEEFRKRLNQKALDEDEEKPSTGGDSSEWYLGEQARNRGSVHSDVLSGFAADLAERGVVAVYPVSGWWKDQPRRDRSHLGARYALVVSIETPGVEADLWTPVAQQVGVPVEVAG
ncbi:S8 family peptidase [Sorangium sp. So ce295]|uniref:S8 family peptidase n=1 Tax=Sorangium sp. So ce295 TaxID=3133295 RepID=UPI003F64657D